MSTPPIVVVVAKPIQFKEVPVADRGGAGVNVAEMGKRRKTTKMVDGEKRVSPERRRRKRRRERSATRWARAIINMRPPHGRVV